MMRPSRSGTVTRSLDDVGYGARPLVLLILGVGAVCLLVVLFFSQPGMSDFDLFWSRWMSGLRENGLQKGYELAHSDYAPLSFLLLHVANWVGSLCGCTDLIALKSLLTFFVILTGLSCAYVVRDLRATILLTLGMTLGTVSYAYLDILYMPTLLLSFHFLVHRRMWCWSLCFAVSCFIKWQPLVLAPFLVLFLLGAGRGVPLRSWHWRSAILEIAIPVTLLGGVLLAVFGLPMARAFKAALSHDYLSGLAFNANWILTWLLEAFAPDRWGGLHNGKAQFLQTSAPWIVGPPRLLFALIYLALLSLAIRRRCEVARAIKLGTAAFMAYATFNVGVHENHYLTLLPLCAVLLPMDRWGHAWLIAWTIFANLNLYLLFGFTGRSEPELRLLGSFDLNLRLFLAVLSVILCILYLRSAWRWPEEELATEPQPAAEND